MTDTTGTKPRVTCTRCNGTGMCGPVMVFQGRCFKCEGTGWYYKGEFKKRGPNLGEQAAAWEAQKAATRQAASCTEQQRVHTTQHFDWGHQMTSTLTGKVHFESPADCLVCQQELLPSEALALFFAPPDPEHDAQGRSRERGDGRTTPASSSSSLATGEQHGTSHLLRQRHPRPSGSRRRSNHRGVQLQLHR